MFEFKQIQQIQLLKKLSFQKIHLIFKTNPMRIWGSGMVNIDYLCCGSATFYCFKRARQLLQDKGVL